MSERRDVSQPNHLEHLVLKVLAQEILLYSRGFKTHRVALEKLSAEHIQQLFQVLCENNTLSAEVLALLASETPLQRVLLRSCSDRVTDEWLVGLLPAARTLIEISVPWASQLTGGTRWLQYMTALRSLSFKGCRNFTPRWVEGFNELRRLETLNLRSCVKLNDECVRRISALRGLRKLNVKDCPLLTRRAIESLSPLTSLDTLKLAGCTKLKGDVCSVLAGMKSLTSLDLGGCTSFSEEDILKLRVMVQLEKLGLAHLALRDSAIALLEDLVNLQRLDMQGTQITDKGIEQLSLHPQIRHLRMTLSLSTASKLERFPNLESLDVSRRQIAYAGGSLAFLQSMRQLKSVTIHHIGWQDEEDFRSLRYLAACPSLTTLTLDFRRSVMEESRDVASPSSQLLGLTSLESLIIAGDTSLLTARDFDNYDKLPKLTSLGLHDMKGVDSLIPYVSRVSRLTSLSFRGSAITDDGVAHLKGHPTLKYLDLSRTRVTDKSITPLLQTLPGLVEVDLSDSSGITPVTTKLLRESQIHAHRVILSGTRYDRRFQGTMPSSSGPPRRPLTTEVQRGRRAPSTTTKSSSSASLPVVTPDKEKGAGSRPKTTQGKARPGTRPSVVPPTRSTPQVRGLPKSKPTHAVRGSRPPRTRTPSTSKLTVTPSENVGEADYRFGTDTGNKKSQFRVEGLKRESSPLRKEGDLTPEGKGAITPASSEGAEPSGPEDVGVTLPRLSAQDLKVAVQEGGILSIESDEEDRPALCDKEEEEEEGEEEEEEEDGVAGGDEGAPSRPEFLRRRQPSEQVASSNSVVENLPSVEHHDPVPLHAAPATSGSILQSRSGSSSSVSSQGSTGRGAVPKHVHQLKMRQRRAPSSPTTSSSGRPPPPRQSSSSSIDSTHSASAVKKRAGSNKVVGGIPSRVLQEGKGIRKEEEEEKLQVENVDVRQTPAVSLSSFTITNGVEESAGGDHERGRSHSPKAPSVSVEVDPEKLSQFLDLLQHLKPQLERAAKQQAQADEKEKRTHQRPRSSSVMSDECREEETLGASRRNRSLSPRREPSEEEPDGDIGSGAVFRLKSPLLTVGRDDSVEEIV